MLIWTVIIALLSAFLVIVSIVGLEPIYYSIIAYLILLVVLGILYRIWSKVKSRRMETISEEIKELRIENAKLKDELEECRKSKSVG